jgi:hypothetical protein
MPPTISNKEAIEMMLRCKHEIVSLRATIDRLQPKADAYENLVTVLRLLPRPGISMGEDLAWVLDKRIQELQPPAEMPADASPAQ